MFQHEICHRALRFVFQCVFDKYNEPNEPNKQTKKQKSGKCVVSTGHVLVSFCCAIVKKLNPQDSHKGFVGLRFDNSSVAVQPVARKKSDICEQKQ